MSAPQQSLLPLTHDPEPDRPRQVIDARKVTWETPEEALCIGLLGFCGCGSADQISLDVAAWLRWRKAVQEAWNAPRPDAPGPVRWEAPESPLVDAPDEYTDLIGYCLDRVDLIDHGGSVGGSWPTQAGLDWLAAIDAIPAAEPSGDETDPAEGGEPPDPKACLNHAVVGPEDILVLRSPEMSLEDDRNAAALIEMALPTLSGRFLIVAPDVEVTVGGPGPQVEVPLLALEALVAAAERWRRIALEEHEGTSTQHEHEREVLSDLTDALGVEGLIP